MEKILMMIIWAIGDLFFDTVYDDRERMSPNVRMVFMIVISIFCVPVCIVALILINSIVMIIGKILTVAIILFLLYGLFVGWKKTMKSFNEK